MTMTLEAIGQKLKSAREAQGLSLRQIYERTKIPINHLQSIDGGVSEDLPEPVYVAGFIKRYAECIGLDGQVLADEYRAQAAEAAAHGNGNGKSNGLGQGYGHSHAPKSSPAPIYVTPEYIRHSKMDNRPPTYKLWVFNALIIVLLLAIIAWYMQANNLGNQQDPSLQSLKESASQLRPAISAGGQAPGAAPVAQVNSDKVSLNATAHVWVEVKALSSGESLYTGYLEQGDRRDFEDPQGIRVRAGNGGNLSVEFKGTIETFGKTGKVTERTFTVASASAPGTTPDGAASTTASSTASTTTAAPVRPRRTPKRTTESSSSGYRKVEDVPSRQYIPGESINGNGGGTKTIDVPYRYSEGRLDAN